MSTTIAANADTTGQRKPRSARTVLERQLAPPTAMLARMTSGIIPPTAQEGAMHIENPPTLDDSAPRWARQLPESQAIGPGNLAASSSNPLP
jgi:hypothetical protein